MTELQTKICKKCNAEKTVFEFYKHKASSDGIACYCKKCSGASSNAYAKENLQKGREKIKRQTSKLGNSYIAGMLGLKVSECPSELINAKREQLLQKRALRELNKTLKDLCA